MFSQLTSSPESVASDRAARTRALKDMVRSHFNLAADEDIFIAEIACGESDCPDVETVIAMFVAGERREFKIRKPILSIIAADLRDRTDCTACEGHE